MYLIVVLGTAGYANNDVKGEWQAVVQWSDHIWADITTPPPILSQGGM